MPPVPPVPPVTSSTPSASIVPPAMSMEPPLPPESGSPVASSFEPSCKATVRPPSSSRLPASKPAARETEVAEGVNVRSVAAESRSVPPRPPSPPSSDIAIPMVIDSPRDVMSMVPPAPPASVASALTRLP